MPAPPPKADLSIQKLHKLGIDLLSQEDDGTPESMHVPARPFFAEVLPKLGLASEVGALLRKMLVLDPEKRSTAKALLESKEYKALLAAAASGSAVKVSVGDQLQSDITPLVGNLQLV
jgi:serine/threonine protein kinase